MFSRLFSARPVVARACIRIRSGVSNPCRWVAHSSVRMVILCDVCVKSSLANHSGVSLRQLAELPYFRFSILQKSKQKMQTVKLEFWERIPRSLCGLWQPGLPRHARNVPLNYGIRIQWIFPFEVWWLEKSMKQPTAYTRKENEFTVRDADGKLHECPPSRELLGRHSWTLVFFLSAMHSSCTP